MSATAVLVAVGEVLGAVLPSVFESLKGGTPASILTHALIVATEEVALKRVATRGTPAHPLAVLATRVEDLAALLVVEQQPILSAELRAVAVELRKRAAALAPTEPAPSATPTSDR
jgi:hypothetical protein